MVDVNVSITTSVSESASVTTSVSQAVSVPAEIDATPSPYADITATNPDLLVPLMYASTAADGQILYEDSGLTTPVDANGEPIGGVDWADNTVEVDVAVDADRPIYTTGPGTPANHAYFSDDKLVAGTNADYLAETGGSIFAVARFDGVDSDQITILCGNLGGGSPPEGFSFGLDNRAGNKDHQLIFSLADGSSFSPSWSAVDAITDSLWHSVGVAWDSTGIAFYVDGASVATATDGTRQQTLTATNPLQVGARGDGESASAIDGGIALEAFYNRVLTASEISDLHDWTGI